MYFFFLSFYGTFMTAIKSSLWYWTSIDSLNLVFFSCKIGMVVPGGCENNTLQSIKWNRNGNSVVTTYCPFEWIGHLEKDEVAVPLLHDLSRYAYDKLHHCACIVIYLLETYITNILKEHINTFLNMYLSTTFWNFQCSHINILPIVKF